jgi:predicted MPP superfamily phosphohydrolase
LRNVTSRRAAIKTLLAMTAAATTSVTVYGIAYERHRIDVTRASLPVAELPPALDGLRIALITDVHHSRQVSAEDVTHAVNLAMAQRPDLIVLGGDYVTYGEKGFVAPVAELLSSLEAPHGVFAVLGNHDSRDVASALSGHRIEVLRDARTRIVVRGESLEIAGIRYRTRGAQAIARVLGPGKVSGTVILLAHDPRRLSEASMLNVPVVLSGHTHGGQIVLPGVGALAARRFPILAGVGSKGNTTIFVSRGIGTVYLPMRVNCPPEVAILTLRPSQHVANTDGGSSHHAC